MVDDLEDLFGTPRIGDESALSTDGVEELFAKAPDKALEVDGVDSLFAPRHIDQDGLTLAATDAPAAAPLSAQQSESIHDLLSALADDLKKLADDIHALLDD